MDPFAKKYYTAYDARYRTVHSFGLRWSSDVITPIVPETIEKYHILRDQPILEIGCGEGRDSGLILKNGYRLTATDVSMEAIDFCKKQFPQYADHFRVLDCLSEKLDFQYGFIYAIAVIHMLVPDDDRNSFYQFIRSHLRDDGIALICTMGDGDFEIQSDITQAFTLQERTHPSGTMMVAGTSCRMVSFHTLEAELIRNGLTIIEKGMTSALPEFDQLMYAVVRKS